MASVSPPEGPYDPVNSGDELESLLQKGSVEPMYLQLQTRSVFRIFGGLKPTANTVAHIKCGDSTIDMTDAEEYEAASGTRLTFWGCNIHRAHSTPLAEQTTYHRCNVYGMCEATDADNHFAFQSAQSFQEEFMQQEAGMTVSWNNSNFTCSPEGVQRLAETESETLMEVVRAQWPYIALAGGLMLLAIVTFIALVVRRSRLRSKRVLAQHGSGHRSGPSAGPKTPPDASVPMPRHRWSDTQSQGTTPGSQRGSMPRASASQMLFVEESGTRCVPSGSANPLSPATLSEGPPGTPGTPQGTSVSSFNSDLPAAIQQTMAQFKRELPDVPLDILQHIGSGGYGNVYRGSWKGLEVAIKTIVFQDRLEDGTAERVIKEAAIACNMSNDHVVNTFAHELKRMPVQVPGELVDYKLYIIQEFCVGGSLAKLLTGEHLMTSVGGVQVNRVLTVLRHVASGMAYMHKLRMVHGDLNPSNVFLQLSDNKYVQTPRRRKKAWKPLTKEAARGLDDGNCTVKLGDFGLTVQLQHGCTHVSNITHGTPFYSAPELATQGRLQCESDVYSFGVLMWEMYHNDTPYDMQDDNYIPNPQFGRFSPTAPLNYALLAISCLSAQPEDRPSFVQVIEFLAAIGLELASGYYTNMNGVTEPTSVISQTPITEMVDYAPHNLLQIHSKIHGASMQSSVQPASMFQGGNTHKHGRSPKQERSRGPSPRGGQSSSMQSSARSQSWHATSLGRSSVQKQSRSMQGSPRPVGEHGEVNTVQAMDGMDIDSEVTLSLCDATRH